MTSQFSETDSDGLEDDYCETIVMEAGRPVMLLPHQGSFYTIGENIIVGWNATREASRAIFDAMPLLEKSKETRLIWVDPHKQKDQAGDIPGAEMAASLARHGVKATAEAMPTSGSIGAGNALLNRASDLGADLIVMGAYGHSRAARVRLRRRHQNHTRRHDGACIDVALIRALSTMSQAAVLATKDEHPIFIYTILNLSQMGC